MDAAARGQAEPPLQLLDEVRDGERAVVELVGELNEARQVVLARQLALPQAVGQIV